MFTTTLVLDFRKLISYFSNLPTNRGVLPTTINLEYIGEENFSRIHLELLPILESYQLQAHSNELLYLILMKNDQIRERYDAYWQNYNDDITSKEVAHFLLAYKTSNANQQFHLTAKPITGSLTIKDSAIARWMMEQIYKAIETKNYTLDLFGEKMLYNLFGSHPEQATELSLERLSSTASMKIVKPTKRINKLYAEFCLYLQDYLHEQTPLTTPIGGKLSNAQASFFFDVLQVIGYLDTDKIQSEPKDYIQAIYQSYVR